MQWACRRDNGDITVNTCWKPLRRSPASRSWTRDSVPATTVRFQAAGNVTQATAGVPCKIVASALGVYTTIGQIDLENVNNSVSTLAAVDTAANQAILFRDAITTPLTIGTVTTNAQFATGALVPGTPDAVGLQANNGDITVNTAGALTINQSILDTGLVPATTVRFQAAGNVTQAARPCRARFVAVALGVRVHDDRPDRLATGERRQQRARPLAVDTAANQAILFRDAITTPLTIGTVTSNALFATAAGVLGTPDAVGLQANNGDITVNTAGALTLNGVVTTGSVAFGTVRLQATGDITQARRQGRSPETIWECSIRREHQSQPIECDRHVWGQEHGRFEVDRLQ